MRKDSPAPELLDALRTPGSRLIVQVCGLLNLVAAVVGLIYVAIGAVFSLLVTKVCRATGISACVQAFADACLWPYVVRWTAAVYKDPTNVIPLQAHFFITLVVYPVLLWNVLSPFQSDFMTFFRSLLYVSALVSYGIVLKFIGLHHLEAHASWVQGGIVQEQWRWAFDRIGEWWFNPLVGVAPGMPSYTHCLVHHKFHNNLEDPQSTLWFDRDSLFQFVFYYCPISLYSRHWGCGGVKKLHEYGQEKYSQAMQDGLTRMCILYGFLAMVNLKFFVFVFVPVAAATTFALSTAEWSMHAFLDMSNAHCTPIVATTNLLTDEHEVAYRSDPWHIVHHALNTPYYIPAQKHSERQMLDSYIAHREHKEVPLYYFNFDPVHGKDNWNWPALWVCLMSRNYQRLAECLVWTGAGPRPSTDELIVFLKRSTEKVDITKYSMERLKEQQVVGPADLKDKKIMKMMMSNGSGKKE